MDIRPVLGMTSWLLTGAFILLLVASEHGLVSVVDPEYMEHGFCVATHETHRFDSYQMCFILDALACAIILCLKGGCKFKAEIMSIFVHGCFHGYQYIRGWPFEYDIFGAGMYIVFTVAFLMSFGVGTKVGSKMHLISVTVVLEAIRCLIVPKLYTFAYVNFWIYSTATFSAVYAQVRAAIAKTPYTDPQPILSSWIFLMGAIVPFAEATLCNRGYKTMGGHAIFDLTIALGIFTIVLLAGDSTIDHHQVHDKIA